MEMIRVWITILSILISTKTLLSAKKYECNENKGNVIDNLSASNFDCKDPGELLYFIFPD